MRSGRMGRGMRKIFDWRLALLIAFILVLPACKVETSAELYLSDVFSVMESGKPETASINYLIEMPTSDKCRLYGPKIADTFKLEMVEFSRYDCLKRDFRNFLLLSGRIQLVKGTRDANVPAVNFTFSGLSAIGVFKNGDSVAVAATLSKTAFEKVIAQSQRLLDQPLPDFEISRIGFILNNDTKKDVQIAVRAGFIDGQPILNDAKNLKVRSKTEILASNVHEKILNKTGYAPVFLVLD